VQDDYDLCESCHGAGRNSGNPMIKITEPGYIFPQHLFKRMQVLQERARNKEEERKDGGGAEKQEEAAEKQEESAKKQEEAAAASADEAINAAMGGLSMSGSEDYPKNGDIGKVLDILQPVKK